jgi:hypothetical protein
MSKERNADRNHVLGRPVTWVAGPADWRNGSRTQSQSLRLQACSQNRQVKFMPLLTVRLVRIRSGIREGLHKLQVENYTHSNCQLQSCLVESPSSACNVIARCDEICACCWIHCDAVLDLHEARPNALCSGRVDCRVSGCHIGTPTLMPFHTPSNDCTSFA